MAKKPRTQVDYNPGQASLQGGVGASEGNYQVSVAPTPKTNAALQFASVINQLPNAAGQLTNYANKVATDRVSQMSDDEILEELSAGDKETFSILKYNKTFNYELVKRKYLMEQQNMANEYDALASDLGNNPDSADIDTAIANMESGLFNKFSGGMTNDLQMQAHKALWNATTTPLKAQAFSKYKALKEDATKMVIESNAMADLTATGNILGSIGNLRGELKSLGVPSKEISQRLVKFTKGYVDMLVFNGRLEEAQEAVDKAETYELFKGAELGGVAENKITFMAMQTQISRIKEASEEDDGETFNQKSTVVKNLISDIIFRLQDDEPLTVQEEGNIKTILTKINPSITDKQIENIVNTIKGAEENKKTVFNNMLFSLGNGDENLGIEAPSDFSRKMYLSVTKHAVDELERVSKLSPYANTGIPKKVIEAELDRVKTEVTNDPDLSIAGLMTKLGHPGVRVPDKWLDIYNEARKGDWVLSTPYYRNLNTFIGDRIRNLQKGFDDNENAALQANISNLENRLKNNIDRQIKNKAIQISKSEQKEEIIEEFANDLIEKEIEIFEAVKDAPQTFESLFKTQPTFEKEDEGVLEDYDTNNDGRIDSKERTKVPRAKRGFLSLGVGDYEEGTISEKIENVITENKDNIRKYPFFGALTLSNKQFNKLRDKKDKDSFYRLLQDTDTKQDILNKIQNDPDYLINVYNQLEDQKDTEALSVSLYYFGYPKFTPKSAKHLAAAKVGIGDIKLFRDTDELDKKEGEWRSALQSQNNLAANTKESRAMITNSIKEAASFGIDSIEDLDEFVQTQEGVIRRF